MTILGRCARKLRAAMARGEGLRGMGSAGAKVALCFHAARGGVKGGAGLVRGGGELDVLVDEFGQLGFGACAA